MPLSYERAAGKPVTTPNLCQIETLLPQTANAIRALQALAKSLARGERRRRRWCVVPPSPKVEWRTQNLVCKCVELFIIHSAQLSLSFFPCGRRLISKIAVCFRLFTNSKLFRSRRQRGFIWKALGRINGFGQIRATLALVVFCVPVDFYLIALRALMALIPAAFQHACTSRECLFALLMNVRRCWKWK